MKEKTIPVKKKEPSNQTYKKLQLSDDENNEGETIVQNSHTVEKITKEIQISLISDDKNSCNELLSFVEDFTLNRNSERKKNNILLNDNKISREHANVILLKNRGFFLQDKGSSNHTYLRINENSRSLLAQGMEILFANSLFKIVEINKNSLIVEAFPKYMIKKEKINELPLKIVLKAKSKVFFGTNPKKNDPDDETYEFKEDETIEKTHAIFHFISDKIYIEPTKTLFG